MTKINFGTIALSESGFPTIEVSFTSAEGERRGYLSPFRGYCFQVSWGPEGDGDAGSSTPIGLKNCRSTVNGVGFGYQSNTDAHGIQGELLAGQAAIALMRFCPVDVNPCVRYFDSHERRFAVMSENNRKFSEFIDACASWLNQD